MWCTPAQAILEKNKNFECSSLVFLFNVISTKLMRSEMASGIDDCIFEDALVEKGNEEGTQHSLLVTRMKSPFQIMYYHVSKERKKLSFSCYEYPHNTRALRKPWIDNVIQQAIYSYQLQNNKKTEKRSSKINSLAKFQVSCTSTQSFWQKLFHGSSNG